MTRIAGYLKVSPPALLAVVVSWFLNDYSLVVVHSFSLLRYPPAIRRSCGAVWSSSSSGSSSELGGGPWKLPNDFETFLNQCSIQSFLFLLKSLRDPQTILWVENFTEPIVVAQHELDSVASSSSASIDNFPVGSMDNSTLLNYHGLAAINTTLFPTWDTYFSKLLEQPTETFWVESSSPHIPNYELEINPASLCSRMISVREQIAREFFAQDLVVLAKMGTNMLDRYWDRLKVQRRNLEEEEEEDEDSNNNGTITVQQLVERENLSFLEYSLDDESDYAPSPLRKGNFDLLVLLATQESILRVLNDPDRQSGAEKASNQFLQNFYTERMLSHFTGNQPYNRADDFLQELLSVAPRMTQVSSSSRRSDSSGSGTTALIDPTRIAELILRQREQVALEWREIARVVPENHMQIKRMQLDLLMGISGNEETLGLEEEEELND